MAIWLGAFVFAWVVLLKIFLHYTIHRGLFHSIPSALISFFATTILLKELFGIDDFIALLFGLFVFIGFLSHLILDDWH